jgi:GNAT superfamily N-acetyltransferase
MIREIVESDIPALFVVRPATRENAFSIEKLEGVGITEESMKAAIESSHRGWLYEEDGEVGGFVMGNSENGELTLIAMLPEHEGKGVGGKLLSKIEDWLESQGCNRIWLTTDIDPNLRAYGFLSQARLGRSQDRGGRQIHGKNTCPIGMGEHPRC